MVIVFVTVASVIVAGVATYFALDIKKQRDDLKVKFEQAKEYADSTAKSNITLNTTVRSLTSGIQAAEKSLNDAERRIADLQSILDSYKNTEEQPVVKVKQASAPTITAKKAKPGRPSKKATA